MATTCPRCAANHADDFRWCRKCGYDFKMPPKPDASPVSSAVSPLVGRHEVSNGLLLRADLHKLFDLGYVTVSPDDLRLEVSRRIHEQFDNGKEYYALHGRELRRPLAPNPRPSREMLEWHATSVFQG